MAARWPNKPHRFVLRFAHSVWKTERLWLPLAELVEPVSPANGLRHVR